MHVCLYFISVLFSSSAHSCTCIHFDTFYNVVNRMLIFVRAHSHTIHKVLCVNFLLFLLSVRLGRSIVRSFVCLFVFVDDDEKIE